MKIFIGFLHAIIIIPVILWKPIFQRMDFIALKENRFIFIWDEIPKYFGWDYILHGILILFSVTVCCLLRIFIIFMKKNY